MYEELIANLRNCAETNSLSRYKRELMKQAADAIEELMRRCEQFQYMPLPSWIPVTERLPDDFQNVLIVFQNGDMAVGFKMTVKTQETILLLWRTMTEEDFCTDCDTPPTHWMPLPMPPKEET